MSRCENGDFFGHFRMPLELDLARYAVLEINIFIRNVHKKE